MVDTEDRVERVLADRYTVERELGRGGMAVVYLARDLRHGRQVALKVLSPDLAHTLGPERFLREIEIAAHLVHPHILPLFDSGSADGSLFYAMPFVQGESLRARLDREGQLPVDDALDIARQVASALTFAHAQGIVHRDIKPENILLAADAVLVADFGIARAITAAGGTRLTQSGIAVGTPVYMSPEQAGGDHEIDGRSDEYSLACVLYEMLAGEPPFSGPSAQSITARKLDHREASISLLRASVPPQVADAVHKALAPVAADRYPTVAQFADALRRGSPAQPQTDISALGRPPRRWERPLWAGLGAVLALVGVLALDRWPGRVSPTPSVVRMSVTLPEGVRVTRGPGYNASSLALSPDGRSLVVAAGDAEGHRLYLRSIDRLETVPLSGTEGGSSPFFSPDGAWIGFHADGKIRRISISGGAAVDVTSIDGFFAGASWGKDDRIIFAVGAQGPLYAVSVAGGRTEAVTHLDGAEDGHSRPELLPGGRVVLFEARGRIYAADLANGRQVDLTHGLTPRYVDGRLIFARPSGLLEATFDASRLTLTGPAVPLIDDVAVDRQGAVAQYAVARTGTLAYLPGAATQELVEKSPEEDAHLLVDQPMVFENPRYSPDGSRVAVAAARGPGGAMDIWVRDRRIGTWTQLTFEGGRAPVWAPDGESVTYSKLGRQQGIYSRRADGEGEAELLHAVDQFHWLVGWTPDGRTLVYGALEENQPDDVSRSSILALTGGRTRSIVGPGAVWGGRLSPDGRWLAYYAMDAGRFQVYVTPFPAGRSRWLIADDGARDPSWGPDGTEVYYRIGDRIMAARIDTSAGVRVRGRRLVLTPFTPPSYDDYHVHPDGRTLVYVRPRAGSDREIVLILNEPNPGRRN